MRVFISWSGDKSKMVAESLRDWLPIVTAGGVECFVSTQDIASGERGLGRIAHELQDIDYGVVVLTKTNVTSPWVNFEAGALGRSLDRGFVTPLLLDIARADVVGPIGQFQSRMLLEATEMRQFVRDLAGLASEMPVASTDALFESKWPELEQLLELAGALESPEVTRSPESMLEEVLRHVRALRNPAEAPHSRLQRDRARNLRMDLLRQRHGGTNVWLGSTPVEALDYDYELDEVLISDNSFEFPKWVGEPTIQFWGFEEEEEA